MASGDFTILDQNSLMGRGGRLYNVASGAGTASLILAGEPVARALGGIVVSPCATSAGQIGTDYIVGVATTNSTNTSTLVGTVNVLPLNPGTTYLANPATAATWDTQAEYDALVGKRVLIQLSAGSYTILATDSANNGLVIMPLDIAKYPGKVAVAFRAALSDLA